MCGITAISRAAASSIGDPARFMRLAALAIESRGPDATGFGWVRPTQNEQGQRAFYWKEPLPAFECVNDCRLPRDIVVAIGHTRWATQGDKSRSENNHPVVDDGIMLVHNGIIRNDDEIYSWLGDDYIIPKAQVDTAAIAALFANLDTVGAAHAVEVMPLIKGDAALAWIDSSDYDVLHLARHSDRPMHLGWTRRGDLVMSSTKESLQHLAAMANIKLRNIRAVEEGTYLKVYQGEIVEELRFEVPKRTVTTYGGGNRSSYNSSLNDAKRQGGNHYGHYEAGKWVSHGKWEGNVFAINDDGRAWSLAQAQAEVTTGGEIIELAEVVDSTVTTTQAICAAELVDDPRPTDEELLEMSPYKALLWIYAIEHEVTRSEVYESDEMWVDYITWREAFLDEEEQQLVGYGRSE
jgi:hypothetical protein